MKSYKKLIGKGIFNDRFYMLKIKKSLITSKAVVSVRKISENLYSNLEVTYFDGQKVLDNYMSNQIAAMDVFKERRAANAKKKNIKPKEKSEAAPIVKLTLWQKIKAFFAKLFGKKVSEKK